MYRAERAINEQIRGHFTRRDDQNTSRHDVPQMLRAVRIFRAQQDRSVRSDRERKTDDGTVRHAISLSSRHRKHPRAEHAERERRPIRDRIRRLEPEQKSDRTSQSRDLRDREIDEQYFPADDVQPEISMNRDQY